MRIFKASPKIERQICKMCDEDVPAVKYCTECCDWLCPNCTLAHRRVKLTKSHVLSDHQSDKIKNIRMCPNHKTEPLKLYCEVNFESDTHLKEYSSSIQTCGVLTCRDCQLEQHQNHKFEYLQQAADREKSLLIRRIPAIRNDFTISMIGNLYLELFMYLQYKGMK